MSKSEGNFYTLRDLLLKGYKASAIRFLLISVPYRQQLNFTFDGLAEDTNAVDRLRTFHQRLQGSCFARGNEILRCRRGATAPRRISCRALQRPQYRRSPRRHLRARPRRQRRHRCRAALGAEIVHADPRSPQPIRPVFDVLEDHDEEVTRAALEWAEREGRLDQAAPELLAQCR